MTSQVRFHKSMEVRLNAACCISELLRLSSPEPPYNEKQLKVIFIFIIWHLNTFFCLQHLSYLCFQCILYVHSIFLTSSSISYRVWLILPLLNFLVAFTCWRVSKNLMFALYLTLILKELNTSRNFFGLTLSIIIL